MDIEIPDSHDPEWVQMMLSQFAGNIEALQSMDCCGTRAIAKELLDDCSQIVDALQQYAGY